MNELTFHIETSPGYGTKQGILPRFYMQMQEICNFLNGPQAIRDIPEKFRKLLIPEIANLYDMHKNILTTINQYQDGILNGTYFKIDNDGDTTLIRKKEFDIANLTKDFFIRGKILLTKFFKADIVVDGSFKISKYFFCDEVKFEERMNEYAKEKSLKYLPLLQVLKRNRVGFLNEFTEVRNKIEHEHFELARFQIERRDDIINIKEPELGGHILSEKIDFFYSSILELIEKLTIYFAAINCEELNAFQKLHKVDNPDYPNLIYGYKYAVMNLPFVFKTTRCDFK